MAGHDRPVKLTKAEQAALKAILRERVASDKSEKLIARLRKERVAGGMPLLTRTEFQLLADHPTTRIRETSSGTFLQLPSPSGDFLVQRRGEGDES